MMSKIKKTVATAALAGAMVLAGGTAAQAATYGSPYKVQTGGTYCPVFMYVDYNWWEEVFLGKRDGAEFQYYAYC